jgi:hypothetical protein
MPNCLDKGVRIWGLELPKRCYFTGAYIEFGCPRCGKIIYHDLSAYGDSIRYPELGKPYEWTVRCDNEDCEHEETQYLLFHLEVESIRRGDIGQPAPKKCVCGGDPWPSEWTGIIRCLDCSLTANYTDWQGMPRRENENR